MTEMINIPSWIQAGFVVLTLSCLAALHRSVRRVIAKPWRITGGVLVWLLGTGVLGYFGFFTDYEATPPRIPVFIALEFMALVYLVFFSRVGDRLAAIPQSRLLLLQSFRVPVEILLAALAARELLPVEMSWHGRNFDVLTGASALLVAAIVRKRGERESKALVVVWNILGLGLLLNVMMHGMLSQPYAFKVLNLSMDNFIVSRFPVIWLPMFLVPLALGLHALSLKRALSREVRLELPGAGIGSLNRLLVKHGLLPRIVERFSLDGSLSMFKKESQRILSMADGLSKEQVRERRLVPQIQGLEDSSRNWSIVMVMEHLLITMPGMMAVVRALNENQNSSLDIRIENFKPTRERTFAEVQEEFARAVSSVMDELSRMTLQESASATCEHPWFGPMEVREWIWLIGVHQGIHRRQITEIRNRLS